MGPIAEADGHDCPRLIDEPVPGVTAVIDDVVVGSEDTVRQPVFPHELPDVFDWIELGRFRRQGHQGDIVGDVELVREVPSCLVEQQHGVGARRHGSGDLRQVQGHGGGVAERQDEAGSGPLGRADGAEEIGRTGPLIVRGRGARPAPRPSPGDLVLPTDPGLVLEPDLYRLAGRIASGDLVQLGREVFLNVSIASVSCA